MPFLADSIETALIRLNFHLQTGKSPPGFGLQGMPTAFAYEWWKNYHWAWEQILLLGGAAALVVFLIGRGRLPGWLLTVLLILGWLGAYQVGTRLVSRWAGFLIAHVNGGPVDGTAAYLRWALFSGLPRFVLYSVPGIVAVRDVLREGQAHPTWLEWTCLGLAAALFLIAEPTELIRNYSTSGPTEPRVMEILVREATLLAAVILGLLMSRLSKPAGSRIEGNRPVSL